MTNEIVVPEYNILTANNTWFTPVEAEQILEIVKTTLYNHEEEMRHYSEFNGRLPTRQVTKLSSPRQYSPDSLYAFREFSAFYKHPIWDAQTFLDSLIPLELNMARVGMGILFNDLKRQDSMLSLLEGLAQKYDSVKDPLDALKKHDYVLLKNT